ncbi:MAG TPA: class I SAM-dependent methyltransferase, partial [Chitinophagales bacterium]
MAWFENWFDTEYYHLLYSHRNDDEAQQLISRLIDFLQLKNASKILDVACGKGRHSKYFAQCGMNVTGIDLSENSIHFAKQFANEKLHFSTWDMREVFAENEFDVVVNLFSSFGYFDDAEDDKRAINAMKKSLKKGGFLILDFMNPEYIVRNLKT